jgi:arylsulfatase A-like enzyme
MHFLVRFVLLLGSLLGVSATFAADTNRHVVVIVWDGMRPDFISAEHTPALAQLARNGVMFANHHPVYVSSTEVNGTAIATGSYPQNSGITGNKEYRPGINLFKPVDTQELKVIRKGDVISGGHFLLRPTLAETLQAAGLTTVIAGTKPVVQLHDRRERPADYLAGILLAEGKVLPASLQFSITNLLGSFPAQEDTNSIWPNDDRDEWTTRALTTVLWSNGVPAFSLLWLSDPDFSQHPSAPGSPKSLTALASADHKLAEVLAELDRRKLRDRTDVFVVSDHGFSSTTRTVDVSKSLRAAGFSAQRTNAVAPPPGTVVVNGLGGSVMLYIVGHDPEIAQKLVTFLQKQDYTGVIFTREKMEGTFTLADAKINSPDAPDIVVSMRWSAGNSKLGVPGLLTADNTRQAGTHGSLSRFDMHNTLVAAGPDLKRGFVDAYPTGNTDLAPTILWLLGIKPFVPMDGRVLSEALTVSAPKVNEPTTQTIETSRALGNSAWRQYLKISSVNDTVYFDEGNGASAKIPN